MNQIEGLFRALSTGVYVVGAAHGDKRSAFTAAWVMPTSYNPPLLAVSVNPEHATHALIQISRAFTINVLKATQLELARRFGTQSSRDIDKLAGVAWHAGMTGAPILDDALGVLECVVVDSMLAGDHELVIGRIVAGKLMDSVARPMMYSETDDMDGSAALYPTKL